jgi:hypothetical protein
MKEAVSSELYIPMLTRSLFITAWYVRGLRMEGAAFTYLRMARWKADGGWSSNLGIWPRINSRSYYNIKFDSGSETG